MQKISSSIVIGAMSSGHVIKNIVSFTFGKQRIMVIFLRLLQPQGEQPLQKILLCTTCGIWSQKASGLTALCGVRGSCNKW